MNSSLTVEAFLKRLASPQQPRACNGGSKPQRPAAYAALQSVINAKTRARVTLQAPHGNQDLLGLSSIFKKALFASQQLLLPQDSQLDISKLGVSESQDLSDDVHTVAANDSWEDRRQNDDLVATDADHRPRETHEMPISQAPRTDAARPPAHKKRRLPPGELVMVQNGEEDADAHASSTNTIQYVLEDDPIEDGTDLRSSALPDDENQEQQEVPHSNLKQHARYDQSGRGILVRGLMFLRPKPMNSGSARTPSASPVDDGFDAGERQLSHRKRSGLKLRIGPLRYSKGLELSTEPEQPAERLGELRHDNILDVPSQVVAKSGKRKKPSNAVTTMRRERKKNVDTGKAPQHQLPPVPRDQAPHIPQPRTLELVSWWNSEDYGTSA